MPAATSLVIRREIIKRRETGEKKAQIAREVGVSYGTVRAICERYEREGRIEPNYERCRQTGIRKDKRLYEAAVALKQEHPSWGAGLIWVELAEGFEESST